jgi:hypothetical protein
MENATGWSSIPASLGPMAMPNGSPPWQ